jgi:hypothetical protein
MILKVTFGMKRPMSKIPNPTDTKEEEGTSSPPLMTQHSVLKAD